MSRVQGTNRGFLSEPLNVREFVYRQPCVGCIAMDDLYSMTVAQLKERLKEKGLPVSGKKAELIARLREGEVESFVPDEKYEVACGKCGTTLRVPTDYSGGISCPNCMNKSQITSPLETDDVPALTGVVSNLQGTENSQHVTTSGYDFVTGPDGQTYAVKKSAFTWGDWCIGFFGTIGAFVLSWVVFVDLADEMCCLLIILSEVGVIGGSGFAAGKPGIGIGSITAVVALPLIFFVGCFFLVVTMEY